MRLDELQELIEHVRTQITDDTLAFDFDVEPGIQLTVGASKDLKTWSYQTGDNSYTGGAHAYPYWAVVGVYRDTSAGDLAQDILDQLVWEIAEAVWG